MDEMNRRLVEALLTRPGAPERTYRDTDLLRTLRQGGVIDPATSRVGRVGSDAFIVRAVLAAARKLGVSSRTRNRFRADIQDEVEIALMLRLAKLRAHAVSFGYLRGAAEFAWRTRLNAQLRPVNQGAPLAAAAQITVNKRVGFSGANAAPNTRKTTTRQQLQDLIVEVAADSTKSAAFRAFLKSNPEDRVLRLFDWYVSHCELGPIGVLKQTDIASKLGKNDSWVSRATKTLAGLIAQAKSRGAI